MGDNLRLLERTEGKIFWGDTPVIGRWWTLMLMYPNSRYIMTDVNESYWYESRRELHCNRPLGAVWDHCNVPLPVELRWESNSSLEHSFYRATHLTNASMQSSNAAFAAYRKLLKCALPRTQLHWLAIKEVPSAKQFWASLIDFLDLGSQVGPRVQHMLVEGGVPYIGHKGCRIGKNKCSHLGGAASGVVVPSVCSAALSTH